MTEHNLGKLPDEQEQALGEWSMKAWDALDPLSRVTLALEQSRELHPKDEQDYGYNHGLDEALRIIGKVRADKVRMTPTSQVEILE